MKDLIKSTILAAGMALGALGMGLAPAAAATVTPGSATVNTGDAGFSWTVNFLCSPASPCNGGSPGGALRARAEFTLTAVTEENGQLFWEMGLVIRNTSALGVGGFLTALGFATNPNAVLSDVWQGNANGINWNGGSGSIPGFGTTELCVYNGNNCSAANEHDMTRGVSDRIGFSLTTGLIDSLTFSDFAVRWAGAGLRNRSFDAGGTVVVTPPLTPVPLPAAGLMLLAGLGGLAALRRKQKAA